MPVTPSSNQAHEARVRRRLRDSFAEFVQLEAFSGFLLIGCLVVAMIWANSPFAASYFELWQTKVSLGFGDFKIDKPLLLWINDGLMAVFFLVVGLEIKRELVVGDLSSAKRAALPIAAALGGMIVPALIYVAFNAGTPYVKGWGIPMATDIAFSLGVLALLGTRAPTSLKLFLTALAIVDDIGAVLVIALFYTSQIHLDFLLGGLGCFVVALGFNRLGVRSPAPYAIVGFFLWACFLKSGVHATIAGVLLALAIPAKVLIRPNDFRAQVQADLEEFKETPSDIKEVVLSDERQDIVRSIEKSCEDVQMPIERMQHGLHPWQTYLIVPVFALANSGIAMNPETIGAISSPVPIGIALGLLFGKPIGIAAFAWLAVRLKLAELPRRIAWRQIVGVGFIAGIGFTMSLFIADLGLSGQKILDPAKIGILAGSILSAIVGYVILSKSADR